MPGCPNSAEGGCCCPEHDPGVAAYAQDRDAYDRAIEVTELARGAGAARLTLVTMPPAETCMGYANGCICSQCKLRAEYGGTPPTPRRALQPWEPRPSRHRRAA